MASRVSLALALAIGQATNASAQVFIAPGGVGPNYNSAAGGGGAQTAYGSFASPNGFTYSSYGGIGPYGGPAFGRVLAGSNVLGYSNSGYSSYSGQYGGFGVPALSGRVGGYSSSSSGLTYGSGGGMAAYGVGTSFGYTQPSLVPGLSGTNPFGATGGLYPFGFQGGSRYGGAAVFLPIGGY